MPMLERPVSMAGWTRVAFGDVVRLSKARVADPEAAGIERVVGLEHIDPGDLRIRRWGDFADGTTFTTLFKPGQVLFGKRRAYQRKVAVADFEGVCSGDIYVLEPANDRLMPELLPFLCQTDAFFDHAVGTSAGSLSPRTNWPSLASFEFLLPPIQEQARLVEAASACRTALDALQDAYIAAVVAEAAYGKSVAHSLTETAPLVAIGNVADVQYGLTVNQKRAESSHYKPYLRVANVQRGAFDLSEIKEIGVFDGDMVHELRLGDVLVVEGHAVRSEIGRAAIWQGEVPGALHQNHLIRIRASGDMLPRYICEMINSPHGQKYFQTRAKSSSGLNTINSSVVREYRIPQPAVSEQEQVVSVFQSMSVQRGNLTRRLADARKLYADLLSAISGQTA
jgi:type I restriction enzyme S subunit